MITRTAISTPEQVTFCNSPIKIVIEDNDIQSAELKLWIWNGELNKTLGTENFRFQKNKIASSDNYIEFEISEYIKSFLVSPPNAPNTSQPVFAYNTLSNPSITGQAVFWQIQTIKTTSTGNTLSNYTTNVSTLGYKFNHEIKLFSTNNIQPGGSLGFAVQRNKYYDPRIHNYISQAFDLTRSLETCTTANVISVTDVTPPTEWLRCSREPFLIVYLNKVGLWDMFTTHGKAVVSSKVESDKSPRLYRRTSSIDNSIQHSMVKDNFKVTQQYSINTGSLKEEMVEQIEEIIYSPKIYLIRFKGDRVTEPITSVTIDNTYITIDTLNTTIDGLTIDLNDLGQFATHEQIPVICTSEDFTRKTRLNDKKDIDFNLIFEETNNKIFDIR